MLKPRGQGEMALIYIHLYVIHSFIYFIHSFIPQSFIYFLIYLLSIHSFIPFLTHSFIHPFFIPIGLFRYIEILTSIRGWDAETREITLRPKGIGRYFFDVQLHSIPASKWSRIFNISKVGYWFSIPYPRVFMRLLSD
jgi:hypothetical protein